MKQPQRSLFRWRWAWKTSSKSSASRLLTFHAVLTLFLQAHG